MKNLHDKNGVSLITLLVVIIVILILASAMVISVFKTTPIESSQEVLFKENTKTYVEELQTFFSNQRLENGEKIDESKVNATATTGTYNNMKIQDIITSMSSADSLKFEIQKGKLVYVGTDTNE